MTKILTLTRSVRVCALMFIVASLATTAFPQAVEAPPCAPAGLIVIDQATADLLVEATAGSDDNATMLRFAGAPPVLTSLAPEDAVLLPPTAALVTGAQGIVSAIDTGPADTTITLSQTGRWLNPTGSGTDALLIDLEPDDDDRSCTVIQPGIDTDFDGIADQASVLDVCERNNGGEFGFDLELADGVALNGVVSVAPFELETQVAFEDGLLHSASFTNTGRISFSGELSAVVDATLDGTRPIIIGSFPVAFHTISVPTLGDILISVFADTYVGACGGVTAGTRAGITSSGIATLGMEIDAGQPAQVIAQFGDSTIDASPPQLDSDAPVDVTIYGGAVLRTRVELLAGGVLPFSAAELDLVVRGSVRTEVDPNASPWWQISGRPEVYVDLSPELLTADLTSFSFDVINPPATTFFTSDNEFPFTLPSAARMPADDARIAGSALRWSRAFLSEENYSTVDVAPASDGGALLVARSAIAGALIRVDFRGERVWQRRVEGGAALQEARQLPDGTFLIGGVLGSDLWLARINDSGGLIWARVVDATDANFDSVRITKAESGEIAVGGQLTDLTSGTDLAPWAASINADGTVNWLKRYGQPGVNEEILDVVGLGDGGLLLVGETGETPPGPILPGSNAYTLRLTPDGSVGWSHVWASANGDRLLSAVQAPDGSFLVAGETGGTNLDAAPRGLLIRFDEDSGGPPTQARWIRALSGTRSVPDTVFDEIKGLANAKDGFIVAGSSRLGVDRTGWLARLVEQNNQIDPVWSYFHDGLDDDNLVALTNVGDGVLAGGTSRSFADGDLDNALWLIRAPLNGYLAWNGPSNAVAAPTALVLAEPPGYPSFADDLNITAEAITTGLEQPADLAFAVSTATSITLAPVGFAPAELVRAPLPFLDSDGDGVRDDLDNCTLAPNAGQRDTNADGFGNLCDADLNDDGIVNPVDLGIFRAVFFTGDADADLDGDGVVNAVDLGVFRQLFFAPPGPSGIAP